MKGSENELIKIYANKTKKIVSFRLRNIFDLFDSYFRFEANKRVVGSSG